MQQICAHFVIQMTVTIIQRDDVLWSSGEGIV